MSVNKPEYIRLTDIDGNHSYVREDYIVGIDPYEAHEKLVLRNVKYKKLKSSVKVLFSSTTQGIPSLDIPTKTSNVTGKLCQETPEEVLALIEDKEI